MTMREREVWPPSTRGAPAEAVLHAGPGGSEATVAPGAGLPQPVEISEPAWSLVLGQGSAGEDELGDLRHFQHLLQEYPDAEGAMTLQAANELRKLLNLVGLDHDATTLLRVPAWVLVICARKLTRALR